MAVIVRAYQSSIADATTGRRLYYPRALTMGNASTDRLAREIADLSSLSPGDVKSVIDNLVTVMGKHLRASESVTLDGIGSFRITLRSDGTGADTADAVSQANARPYIAFRPARRSELLRGITLTQIP